ncbi:hypothetical protein R1sor_022091 [Riccia sorocarpa]|uniref:CCHC-type domain-containing protein n=1 Tax=Riccia sorocarpa TaxID=122646 RepID=A0ABD3GM78_9MARC
MGSPSGSRSKDSPSSKSDRNRGNSVRAPPRRDLFNDGGNANVNSPLQSAPPLMIANQIFEASPVGQQQAASPITARWVSGTQSYARIAATHGERQPARIDSANLDPGGNISGADLAAAVTDSQPENSRHSAPLHHNENQGENRSGSPQSHHSRSQENGLSGSPQIQFTHTRDADKDSWAASEVEISEEDDEGCYSLSELDEDKRQDRAYMRHRRWKKGVMKEVSEAFRQLPELNGIGAEEEVAVEHTFTFDAQVRMQAQKRRGEDCGIVFCTVDMSPSRDMFTQWIYQEVENKAAVQSTHIKVIAPRHYLVLPRSRDSMLAAGPYYMRKRMVLQTAGVTDKGESKFRNIRGCVLMDMSKPLPNTMRLNLNGEIRKIAIKYDTLPDACFLCQERGHFARSCPQKNTKAAMDPEQQARAGQADFIPVRRGGRNPVARVQPNNEGAGPSNPYAPLTEAETEDEAESNQASQSQSKEGTGTQVPVQIPASTAPESTTGEAATGTRDPGNTGGGLLDLNQSPALTSQTALNKQSEKDRRKARKKEKKLEARRRRALSGLPPEALTATDQDDTSTASEEDNANNGDSETGSGKFWQRADGKKPRGNKTTMETDGRWADQT